MPEANEVLGSLDNIFYSSRKISDDLFLVLHQNGLSGIFYHDPNIHVRACMHAEFCR